MTQAQTIPSNAEAECSVDLQLFDSDLTVNKRHKFKLSYHFHSFSTFGRFSALHTFALDWEAVCPRMLLLALVTLAVRLG